MARVFEILLFVLLVVVVIYLFNAVGILSLPRAM